MLTLLNPAALLALLGLLVPVAIHLWNRRPGREVAVGSLRWLAAGANRRLRNLKPEQLWLLLLRAALLAVLAVATAGPAWRRARPAGRGVVLLSPAAVGLPAFAAQRPVIDSLRRRGYTVRWLAAGFPNASGAAGPTATASGRAGARMAPGANRRAGRWLWARVQQAGARFPGQPLYVVTPAALAGFRGAHRPLRPNITWQALPDTAATSWLAGADVMGDSLQLLVGRSSETRTFFRRMKVLRPRHGGELIRVAGLASLRFQPEADGSGSLVPVPAGDALGSVAGTPIRAQPLDIVLYSTPQYAADARCLEAASRAAALGLAIPPRLRRVTVPPAHLGTGWTFWLSDKPLPATWRADVRRGGHLWREAAGPGVADTAQLATATKAASVAVFRRGTEGDLQTTTPVWSDGRGRAVLTRQPLGRGAIYQLNTRLSPAWSELADDPQLPARLLALLQPEPTDEFSLPASAPDHLQSDDRRALDPTQLLTGSQPGAEKMAHSAKAVPAPEAFRFTDFRPWLVLMAGLLFLGERLLARRREMRTLTATAP